MSDILQMLNNPKIEKSTPPQGCWLTQSLSFASIPTSVVGQENGIKTLFRKCRRWTEVIKLNFRLGEKNPVVITRWRSLVNIPSLDLYKKRVFLDQCFHLVVAVCSNSWWRKKEYNGKGRGLSRWKVSALEKGSFSFIIDQKKALQKDHHKVERPPSSLISTPVIKTQFFSLWFPMWRFRQLNCF